MHKLFVRIVAVLAVAALWSVFATQVQAQTCTPLGNRAMGNRPVSMTYPSNLASSVGLPSFGYYVNNEAQPRLPAGQTRTYTPRGSNGVRIRFHNGTYEGEGNARRPHFVCYQVYGGRYVIAVNSQRRAFILKAANNAPSAPPSATGAGGEM